jgi:hypothetical protein
MRHWTSSIRANLTFILDGVAMTTVQDALDAAVAAARVA